MSLKKVFCTKQLLVIVIVILLSNNSAVADSSKVSSSPLQATVKFALHPAYPNPFNSTTEILFDVGENARVSVKIFDILGNEVTSLEENRALPPGFYSTTWNVTNWDGTNEPPSGLYFVQLRCNLDSGPPISMARKIILLR